MDKKVIEIINGIGRGSVKSLFLFYLIDDKDQFLSAIQEQNPSFFKAFEHKFLTMKNEDLAEFLATYYKAGKISLKYSHLPRLKDPVSFEIYDRLNAIKKIVNQ